MTKKLKKLNFGTSGLRDTVENMTDLECYINTRGFLKYLAQIKEFKKGDTVVIAGDHRQSTPRIKRAVAIAVKSLGGNPDDQGRLPSPALIYYAMTLLSAGIMVTGSHIPDDRNGIKFSKKSGEVLKSDEKLILNCVEKQRKIIDKQRKENEIFNNKGMFLKKFLTKNIGILNNIDFKGQARELYKKRYISVFKDIVPKNTQKIFLYQHSSVSRDILKEIFDELGLDVISDTSKITVEIEDNGKKIKQQTDLRSEAFIPVDTESVAPLTLAVFKKIMNDNNIDIGITTDGDGDRPLIVYRKYQDSKPTSEVLYITGDILGVLCVQALAEFGVSVDHAAVPVSANDAIEKALKKTGVNIVRTKIGSPYVIAQMNAFLKENNKYNIVSWEANGGFLTASDFVFANKIFKSLPSRDALLPLITVVLLSFKKKKTICQLIESLPKRYTYADRKKNFPLEKSAYIIKKLSIEDKNVKEIVFDGVSAVLTHYDEHKSLDYQQQCFAIKTLLESVFIKKDGFSAIKKINYIDGIRIIFSNHEISHLRPSGNAPEFRNYAMANSLERAKNIVSLGIDKIIPQLSS